MIKKRLLTPLLNHSKTPSPSKLPKLSKTSASPDPKVHQLRPKMRNLDQQSKSTKTTLWKNRFLTYVPGMNEKFSTHIPICGSTGSMASITWTGNTSIIRTMPFCGVFFGGSVWVSFRNTRELWLMQHQKLARNGYVTRKNEMNLHYCYALLVLLTANLLKKRLKNLIKLISESCWQNFEKNAKNQKYSYPTPTQRPRATARGDLGFDHVSALTDQPAALKKTANIHTSVFTAPERAKETFTVSKIAKITSPPAAIVKPACNNLLLETEIEKKTWISDYMKTFIKKMTMIPNDIQKNPSEYIKTTSLNYAKTKIKKQEWTNETPRPHIFSALKYDFFHSVQSNHNLSLKNCPQPSNFDLLIPNQKNIEKIIRMRKPGKIPTFNKKFQEILMTVKPFWENLAYVHKDTAICMIVGFIEKQNLVGIKLNEQKRIFQTTESRQIRDYVKTELKNQRLIQIDKPETIFEKNEIIMSRCLAIKKPEKDSYRFVYDNTPCNKFILPIGVFQNGPISFTTPSIETILLSPLYLAQLQRSRSLQIYDATDYYRQIYTDRSAWNLSMFQLTTGETYLDVTSRMGHTNSSVSAQRVSDLKDWLFNNSGPYAGTSLTNQDDTIIMDSNEFSGQKFRHFADNLGIKINESKNQAGPVVTWCGYDIDVAKQTIRIRKKRILKLERVAEEIVGSNMVKRKMIAVLLGSIHSCRPIILGQWKFTSPLLFFTRKSTYLFQNVYEEKIMDSSWYQEEVIVNEYMKNEIVEAVNLVTKEVEIGKAARGLDTYLNIGLEQNLVYDQCNLVFSDASDLYWGVTIKIGANFFSFSGEFEKFVEQNWSIYVKEYYACVAAKILFLFVTMVQVKGPIHVKTVHFIDNTGAKAVLQSRKVSLKSLEIGILAKFNQLLSDRLNERHWSYEFIDSESNRWADYCSREGVNAVCNVTEVFREMCPFVCLLSGVFSFGNINFLTKKMIKNLNL